MILTRFQAGKSPQVVLCSSEQKIVKKLNDLDLTDWVGAIYYKRGQFENLGTNGELTFDYYVVYEDAIEMTSHIKELRSEGVRVS